MQVQAEHNTLWNPSLERGGREGGREGEREREGEGGREREREREGGYELNVT